MTELQRLSIKGCNTCSMHPKIECQGAQKKKNHFVFVSLLLHARTLPATLKLWYMEVYLTFILHYVLDCPMQFWYSDSIISCVFLHVNVNCKLPYCSIKRSSSYIILTGWPPECQRILKNKNCSSEDDEVNLQYLQYKESSCDHLVEDQREGGVTLDSCPCLKDDGRHLQSL